MLSFGLELGTTEIIKMDLEGIAPKLENELQTPIVALRERMD